MTRVVVVGASLGGLAAAARLAKAGHEVVLVTDRPVADLPGPGPAHAIELPAAWRDLFRKSGRVLDAALARHGLTLSPAPPEPVLLGDAEVAWPTDRGQQYAVISGALGARAAEGWRDAVDRLGDLWQGVRRLGVEYELETSDPQTQRLLASGRTVADLAREVDPRLAPLVLATAIDVGSDPALTPEWMACRLFVQRTFGLWRLEDADGAPQPQGRLVGALRERLAERRVEVREEQAAGVAARGVELVGGHVAADAVVSAVDLWRHAALTGREVAAVARRRQLGPFSLPRPPVPLARAATAPADDPYPAWAGPATWRALPARLEDRVFYAGSGGLAGPQPWARLLTGALATYAVHEALTGEDIRPTNKALVTHRRPA